MKTEHTIHRAIDESLEFVSRLENENEFRLFERSEPTPYARCFVIFIKALCQDNNWIETHRASLNEDLNSQFGEFYDSRKLRGYDLKFDKPILQLLCFTLSALSITRGELSHKNQHIVKDYLSSDLSEDFKKRGVFSGTPGSGNYSMFVAVILYYCTNFMAIDCSSQITEWINLHLKNANKQGFWGQQNTMQYLQFQNGYHQYEIFEALGVSEAPWTLAAKNTIIFADELGHFAPYPGGGGCYDYDAIFMLTSPFVADIGQSNVVKHTLNTILKEQNNDGGFCESQLLRTYGGWPRPFALISHVLKQPVQTRINSTISGLNLYRPKHRYVRTHWCETDRFWNESNAWDTYFRLLLVARASKFLECSGAELFEINDFPGIG